MRLLEEPYWTPDGTLDFPFMYVYNTATFTDGQNFLNLVQQLQGDSAFVLRRIMGVPLNVAAPSAGKFNYRNPNGEYAAGNASTGIIVPPTWPVVPEKLYRVNDQIAFDLYDVLRNNTVCSEGTIYNSQIAFSGVKRFPQGTGYPKQVTPYRYYEKAFTYDFSLTVNWAHFDGHGNAQPSQRFNQQMDNWDFELCSIRISQPGSTGALTTNDFQISLYDPNLHAFSNNPVNQLFYNAGRPTPSTSPANQATFPTPTVLYPAGSAITFDITSMLCAASLPQVYDIAFMGIRRINCQ